MTPHERKARTRDWVIIVLMGALLLVVMVAVVAALNAKGASDNATRASEQAKDAANRANEAIAQIAREGAERRDDSCRKDERLHLEQVTRLRRTYEYLAALTPKQRREPINAAVLRFLPQTERDARVDPAPDFCDEPGEKAEALWYRTKGRQGAPPVGLREPDPVVPERPAALK